MSGVRPIAEVLAAVRRDATDDALRSLAEAVRAGRDERDVAAVAEFLGGSGCVLPPDADSADLASTGGAGSMSTIMGPLFLRAFGAKVPVIGVPGRPAGAVDVLGQLPGYRLRMSESDARHVLRDVGYVHLAAGDFAPLDGRLFALRRAEPGLDHPDLAIASLLAKKVAAGVTRVGLDVRVHPAGAFGGAFAPAARMARRFIRVARRLGITAVCFLTDGSRLAQPYLGRGESLLALDEVLEGRASGLLLAHVDEVATMARTVLGSPTADWSRARLAAIFADNIVAQGSDPSGFAGSVETVRAVPRTCLRSSRAGFVQLDLPEMRRLILEAQSNGVGTFPDPAGIISEAADERLAQGARVLSVRSTPPDGQLARRMRRAFSETTRPFPRPRPMVVIADG